MTLLHGFLNSRSQSEDLDEMLSWLANHEGFEVCTLGMNGEIVHQIFSSRNGTSESWLLLKRKLENAILSEAKDTYGLFFLYDLSGTSGDNWLVWKVANNEITILEDVYLSPYSEIIEPPTERNTEVQ